jgi:predicted amidophosphoribosyltransferase
MDVNIKKISGVWDWGYSLDKHTIRSVPTKPNSFGHMQYDTIRSEAGEAVYQLKYQSDYSQELLIAQQLNISFGHLLTSSSLIIPMPASKNRTRQPVTEIAKNLAQLMAIPCYKNLLLKTKTTPAMKDIETREEKISTLTDAFTVYDVLNKGENDILIVDDLFDTGSSLEAATIALKKYSKIRSVYVVTVTRKK